MNDLDAAVAARWLDVFRDRYTLVQSRTGDVTVQAWRALGNVDAAAADTFAATAGAVVDAAHAQVSDLTVAYLAGEIAALAGDKPFPISEALAAAIAVAMSEAALRRGATTAEVYRRPVVTARTALARGRTWLEAMASGEADAHSYATTDVALAHRATAQLVMDDDERVVGYRRVLSGRSCVLCATASTQRYHTGQLLPIHAHCDCTTAPIVGDADPGRVINEPLVRALREKGGPEYWKAHGLEVDDDGIVRRADGAEVDVEVDHGTETAPTLTAA